MIKVKRLFPIFCLLSLVSLGAPVSAQTDSVLYIEPDTMYYVSVPVSVEPFRDPLTDSCEARNAALRQNIERLQHLRDSLVIMNDRFQQELENKNQLLESQIKAMREKEQLISEKEQLYKDAMNASTVDRTRLQGQIDAKEVSINAKTKEIEYLQNDIDAKTQVLAAQKSDYDKVAKERDVYRHLVDSLRGQLREAELKVVRAEEENKYLEKRAKDAEERNAVAANRRKKVRPIQGIALRFFRTPKWEIRLSSNDSDEITKVIRNRNAGKVEFDYVTGADVMLWDMTKYFNKNHKLKLGEDGKGPELKKFDQQYAYDLGLYVGFGGSNLFKNFYLGLSFRFVDFFYLVGGVNIAEYEVLVGGYKDGNEIKNIMSIDDVTAKAWLVKPFIALGIDLDFLSYIKK